MNSLGAFARLASARRGPGAAVRRTPALGRLAACVADPSGRAALTLPRLGLRLEPLSSLVIALAIISQMRRCGDPKSERPENASGSSVSGRLLVMCVLGACGLVGTVYDTRASRQGRPGSLVMGGVFYYQLDRYRRVLSG